MGSATGPVLDLRNLRIAWGGSVLVENLSLAVRPREIGAVLGGSGTGKTTVLRTAAGLLAPAGGTVVRTTDRLAVAFQEPRLLPWRTVEDNLLFPLGRRPRPEERRRARGLLDQLGLADRATAMPATLSGGMSRRVSLARALLVEPELLIVDEPFAHLDRDWADRVEQLLAAAARDGAAIVLAAHQPERIARLASLTVELSAPAGTGGCV